jgi:hypothetical protein
MIKIRCLFFTFLIVFTISIAGLGEQKAPLRVTKKLPAIDKVKMVKVIPAEIGIKSVVAKKTIKGKEAEVFAALWRSQTFLPYSTECHAPGFVVKLFSKGNLIVEASLCWECNTIDFFTPQLSGAFYQGFQGDNKKGQEMLDFLKKAFP